jgi:hypothetical protein
VVLVVFVKLFILVSICALIILAVVKKNIDITSIPKVNRYFISDYLYIKF